MRNICGFSSFYPANMRDEDFLRRLGHELSPSEDSRERVRTQMMARMRAPELLKHAHSLLTPADDLRDSLKVRIINAIAPRGPVSALGRLRAFFMPSKEAHEMVRQRVMARLIPKRHPYAGYNGFKWVSAFVLVLIALRVSPMFLLAPSTAAESSVLVIPTHGVSSVLLHGLWQPVAEEISLAEGARLRTEEGGEMTVILHDDGNVRLGSDAAISLHDISNRPEPALDASTMTAEKGAIWVQSLLLPHLRGITVTTPYGDVVMHSASVSITVGETVDIQVWDGHVNVLHHNASFSVVAGERLELSATNTPSVRRIADGEDATSWVKQNLERDALHRREVAQWQQERRAAAAGILPNNPLYTAKRIAEKVDILLTFDDQQWLEKKLAQASVRLYEASTLSAQGESGATVPLEEYKATLQEIASDTSSGSVAAAQFMLRQEIAENTAQFSAAAQGDDVYDIKKAVLEAGAALPEQVVDERDVQGTILVDTLNAVHEAVNAGDITKARESFAELQPYLDSLEGENDELKPDIRKEALALLSTVASALGEGEQTTETGSLQKDLLKEVVTYVPKVKNPERPPMTESEINALVERIYDRIFVYTQPRARWNQLQYEMMQLRGHPDEGTILRHLYHALPENGLARYVRTEIQRLRLEMEGQ
jgi:hypothetical protein